jgi:DNA repair exonuclease SbcCD nuclease subunit
MKKSIVVFLVLISQNVFAQYKRDVEIVKTENTSYKIESYKGRDSFGEIYYSYHISNLANQINPDSLYQARMSKRNYYKNINPFYRPVQRYDWIDSLLIATLSEQKVKEFYLPNSIEAIDILCTYDLSGKIWEVQEIEFSANKKITIDVHDIQKIENMLKTQIELEPKEDSYKYSDAIKAYQQVKYFTFSSRMNLDPTLKKGYHLFKGIPKFDKPVQDNE